MSSPDAKTCIRCGRTTKGGIGGLVAHTEARQCPLSEADAVLAAAWKVGKVRCSGCGNWVHEEGFPLHTLAKKCHLRDPQQVKTVLAWRESTVQCSGCKAYVARNGLSRHAADKGCLPRMSSQQYLEVLQEGLSRAARHGNGRGGRGRGRGKARTPLPRKVALPRKTAVGAPEAPASPLYIMGGPVCPVGGAYPSLYLVGGPVYPVVGSCSAAEPTEAVAATLGWSPPPGLEAPPAWITPDLPAVNYTSEELFRAIKTFLSNSR